MLDHITTWDLESAQEFAQTMLKKLSSRMGLQNAVQDTSLVSYFHPCNMFEILLEVLTLKGKTELMFSVLA